MESLGSLLFVIVRRRVRGGRHQNSLARQLDAVLVVYSDHFDFERVTNFADVRHVLHEAIGQFADVAQSVLARRNLDEGAKSLIEVTLPM